jgi:hypothetical protein
MSLFNHCARCGDTLPAGLPWPVIVAGRVALAGCWWCWDCDFGRAFWAVLKEIDSYE